MPKAKCEVRGGRMTVAGDLSTDSDTNFDGACQQLLADPSKTPVVDLSSVTFLSSTYVGLLAELGLGVGQSGRKLTIVAGTRIAALLREAGLGSIAAVENAPGKKPRA
ncbi:MAG TPA: STAS domain-containing protein [Planctomycetota bacterium]|nr:STAS domain-containing protein [Planctomycetota bacterium]